MRYVVDTNIILHIVRNSDLWKKLKADFNLTSSKHMIFISIVTYAEIKSIAKQLNWGKTKQEILQQTLTKFPILYLNKKVADYYIEIDVFSQGKDLNNALPFGVSSRNMGKNDIWIAALTKQISAELITTDNDFDHLDSVFFEVHKIAL